MHGGELTQSITSTNPHSGIFSALLGDPAYECEGDVPVGSAWVEQTVFVPVAMVSPRLSFWYRIVTQDKNPNLADEFDSFDVWIDDVRVFQDAKKSGDYGCNPGGEEDLGWKNEEIDVTQYKGQYITVRFENRSTADYGLDTGWYNTWTYVDDVQIIPKDAIRKDRKPSLKRDAAPN
jgi:hypothetical protein